MRGDFRFEVGGGGRRRREREGGREGEREKFLSLRCPPFSLFLFCFVTQRLHGRLEHCVRRQISAIA